MWADRVRGPGPRDVHQVLRGAAGHHSDAGGHLRQQDRVPGRRGLLQQQNEQGSGGGASAHVVRFVT